MKNKRKLFSFIIVGTMLLTMVFINIPNVRAVGEHEFSFTIYDCNEVDESRLTDTVDTAKNRVTQQAAVVCQGPNGEGDDDLPEIASGSDVEPGKIIKVGVHYVPGTQTDVGMQVKFFYNSTALEPINFSKYNRSSKTYSDSLAYDLGPDLVDLYENWGITPSDTGQKINFMANDKNGSAGDELMDELDMVYFYFRVKDDTAGSTLAFNFDTTAGTGTAMNNKSAIKATDSTLNVFGQMSSDVTLGTLSVKNGSSIYPLTPEFSAGMDDSGNYEKSYTTYVPNQISSVDIAATPHDENATLTGTGTFPVSLGDNSFEIVTTAQNGSLETFTINVRRLNNDARLSSLSLTNVNIGTFESTKTAYTATVPYSTSSTTVSADVYGTSCTDCTAVDNAGKAKIDSGLGNWSLTNSGETVNSRDILVKAENCDSKYSSIPGNTCTSKTYSIEVTRTAPSAIKTLSDLTVDGTTVPGFNPTTYTYDLGEVSNSKTSVTIGATVTDTGKATVKSGTGNKPLSSVGENELIVTVQAENGDTQDYKIKFYRLSNDSKLKSLSVTSDPMGTLSPAFSSTLLDYYTYTAPATVDTVNISGVVNDTGKATIISGTGEYNIAENPTVDVTVQAEDGSQSIYVVKLVRQKSDNNYLSSLTVDGYTLSPVFNKETTSYTVNVDGTVSSVDISATVEDTGKATIVSGTGTKNLTTGNNEVTIKVKAENGTTKDYTVNIIKAKKTMSALTDLKVDGTTVPGFSETKLSYDLTKVPFTKGSVEILATVKDPDSTVTGDGTVSLNTGDNALHVVVTAEDGTTQTIYTINIEREKDSNNYLSDLTIDGTTITGFVKTTNDYTVTVENEVKSLNLVGTPESTSATVEITGNSNFVTTSSNEVKVTVTAENGDVNIYKVNVTRKKSDNNYLKSLTTSEGTLSPVFNKETTSYTIDVDRSITSLVLTPTKEDPEATVSIDGPSTLSIGENTYTITVTSESNKTKEYTVVVKRNPSSNNNLLNLTVNGTSVPDFSKEKTSYIVNVDSDVRTAVIAATKEDEHATITGEGTFDLVTGENNFDVTVTAEDTTTKTYTITINKAKSSDSSLSNLTILQTTLNETFEPTKLAYTANVDYSVTEVDIAATPNDPLATVIGDGKNSLTTGDNLFNIVVTAEDLSTTTYSLNVIRAKNNNAKLSNITVSGGYSLTPVFDPETESYSVNVPNTVSELELTGYKQDPNAVSVVGDGVKTLSTGNNEVNIVVTAEDGTTTKTYKVVIYRELSSDATLKSLVPSVGTLNPIFDPTTEEYEINVPNEVETVTFTAETTSSAASYIVSGNDNLSVGNNESTITVQAEDGTLKLYKVNIKRQPSSNNFLSGLSVKDTNNVEYIDSFSKTKLTYEINVENDITEVNIDATLEDSTSTITGTGNKSLSIGLNEFSVKVTSAADITREYLIKITRKSNSNAFLSSLEVEGYNIVPVFNKNITSYTLDVDNNVNKVTINATQEATTSTVTGTGEYTLTTGPNTFNVDVTAEDLTTMTYTIVITKAASSNNNLGNLSVTPGNLQPEFTKDETAYKVHVDNSTSILTITANAEDETATIEGDGIKSLNVGKQTFNVVVTAENGSKKTYEIEVERDASSNNYLTDLTIDGTTVTGFNKEVLEYEIEYTNDVTSINIGATQEDITATIGGIGDKNLSTGLNTIEIPVTAENGDIRTYKLKVTRAKSSNNYLSVLSADEGTMTPEFNKTVESYNITVPYEVTSLTLTATPEDSTASVNIEQNSDFEVGTNTVLVNVIAEDNSERIYRINVTRQQEANNFLTNMIITGNDEVRYSLSPVFDRETYSYTVELDKNLTSVNIEVEKETPSLIVTGDGTVQINSFPQTHDVLVSTTDGQTRTYKLNFVQGLSSNAYLKSLSIDKGELTPVFDKTNFAYTVDLPKGTNSLNITTEKDESSQTIIGGGNVSLSEGRNTIDITVTAENGNTNTYTIVANVATQSDNILKTLTVDKGELSPAFDKDINSYTVDLTPAQSEITISATGDYTITGTGTFPLVNGSNVFKVETEKNGEKNTYTITVNNGSVSSNSLESLSVEGYSFLETFDKDLLTYNLAIENPVTSVTVNAIPENPAANVTITGADSLAGGMNTVTVTVTDPTLGSKTYTINVLNGQTKIVSDIHTIDTTYVKTIRELKTSDEVKSEMLNPNEFLKIYDHDNNEIQGTDIVCNGYTIKLIINGVEYDSKVLIIKGDTNNNGEVDVADIVRLERYILGTGTLSSYELEAGDVNDDGFDEVADLLLIERHILQNYNIFTKEVM